MCWSNVACCINCLGSFVNISRDFIDFILRNLRHVIVGTMTTAVVVDFQNSAVELLLLLLIIYFAGLLVDASNYLHYFLCCVALCIHVQLCYGILYYDDMCIDL